MRVARKILLLGGLYAPVLKSGVGIRLGLALVVSLVAAILTAAAPVQLKNLVDTVSRGANGTAAFSMALGVVALLVGAKIVGEAKWFWLGRAEQDLDVKIAGNLFEQTLRLDPEVTRDLTEGGFTQRFMSGLEGARLLLQQLVMIVIPALFDITAVVAVVAAHAPGATLVFVLAGACLAGVAYQLSAWSVAPFVGAIARQRGVVASIVSDAVGHIEAVKLARAESRLRRRLDGALKATRNSWISLYDRRGFSQSFAHLIFGAAFAACFGASALAAAEGHLSVGELSLTYACFLQLVRPIEGIGVGLRDAIEYGRRALDAAELAAGPPEFEAAGSSRVIAAPIDAAIVVLDRVGVQRDGRSLITNLSLSITRGSFVAIVGPSGAGKSTLIRILVGLRTITSGRMWIAGHEAAGIGRAQLRELVGIAPQEPAILNVSLEENLLLSNPNASAAEIDAVLQVVELDPGKWDRHGDWSCGPNGARLSGGERQRLALARVLLAHPTLLVLDEATSGFDAPLEARVLARVREWMADGAVVIVTHRLANVVGADHIVVVERGSVAEQGTHSELLKRQSRYWRLWCRELDTPDASPSLAARM